MYPLKLKSVLKDIIWGGTALSEKYGKGTAGQKIAEAWVLSCRADGENIIENGDLAGKPLSIIYKDKNAFPLLIKLIDAHDKLSVQVHPNDEYAKKEGLPAGKTEMWYILDAKPGAKLVYGLKKDIDLSNDNLKLEEKNGTLEQYLNFREVKKGDVLFIPSGLVHAIGDGILIAEVQQNSNTTYRIYDYGRKDANGKCRELHIDKAAEVIDRSLPVSDTSVCITEKSDAVLRETLCSCDCFTVEKLNLNRYEYEISSDKMLFALCTEGCGEFSHEGSRYKFVKGDGYLFPAGIGKFSIISDECELLFAYK